MIKLLPLLALVAYGFAMWRFSAWQLGRELDARSRPLADARLVPVLTRLARAIGVARIPLHLYEIEPINGLAAPDGRVFLTRGFLTALDRGQVTAEELGAVVAHELGHVALGHSRRRMIDFTGQNALRVVLAAVLGRFLPGLGILIANLVASALAARLSRQDEYEADAYASALLVKAGIGTAPQKALFTRLERLTGAPGAAAPAWILSHPKAADRIAAIEALEARWRPAPRD